ncbi:hypothetical protein RRG08_018545 [Elysia crispata]|uniref:Uncharacterized protein n=1 Tax=Elysia crispata TaxID=231223 RepID=A0AAE1ANR7_9GAST|nr:hypothetical protein RRG08_018545 [Elysia crispata]
MHKAINIKHRVVRRVDIEIAPLATFDTIDLGDEDVEPIKQSLSNNTDVYQVSKHDANGSVLVQCHTSFSCNVKTSDCNQPGNGGLIQTRTIGGNTSKKSLSQAGGEKGQKDAEGLPSGAATSGSQNVENVADTPRAERAHSAPQQPKSRPDEGGEPKVQLPETQAHRVPYDRQGSLGRVSLPVRQPDSSSSSSSSPESCSEKTFTFQTLRAEASHLPLTSAVQANNREDLDPVQDKYDNLTPEVIDPTQILSPSKRKAYERRIERLKVTTSPIARPRSTTPINVVSLDEYATISSPDASPASPSVLQDKLKITLPADEFAAKPKTPKHYSGKRRSSEDTVFHFNEENLFSRSKSTLLVEGDGQLPLSPRRVLLPPALTPTSSPRLSTSPRLSKPAEPESIPPTVSFSQQKATVHKFFGETVDEVDEDNWASFPEPSPTIETPLSAAVLGLGCNTPVDALASSSDLIEQPGNSDPELLLVLRENPAAAKAEPPSQVSPVFPTTSHISDSSSVSTQPSTLGQSAVTQEKLDSVIKSTDIESESSVCASIVSDTRSQPQLNHPQRDSAGDDILHNLTYSSEKNLENFLSDPHEQKVNFDPNTFQQRENVAPPPYCSVQEINVSLLANEPSHIATSEEISKIARDHPPSSTLCMASVADDSFTKVLPSVVDASQGPSPGDASQCSLAVEEGESSFIPRVPPKQPDTNFSDQACSYESHCKSNTNTSSSSSANEIGSQHIAIEDSQPQHTVSEDSQEHQTLSEDSKAQQSVSEILQPEKGVLEDSKPQNSPLEDSQSQHVVLQDFSPQLFVLEDSQLEHTQCELLELEHTLLENSNPFLGHKVESSGAPQELLPSLCLESDRYGNPSGVFDVSQGDNVRSEPGEANPPLEEPLLFGLHTGCDLLDSNPFSASACLQPSTSDTPATITPSEINPFTGNANDPLVFSDFTEEATNLVHSPDVMDKPSA